MLEGVYVADDETAVDAVKEVEVEVDSGSVFMVVVVTCFFWDTMK